MQSVHVRLRVRLCGVGHLQGKGAVVQFHTDYEGNNDVMKSTIMDALNKLGAKEQAEDVVIHQDWVEDVQEKAIDGTLSQECTSPFSMALSEFLNNLAKHTKKSGSVEDAFNTLQRTDHHLGKWSENLVNIQVSSIKPLEVLPGSSHPGLATPHTMTHQSSGTSDGAVLSMLLKSYGSLHGQVQAMQSGAPARRVMSDEVVVETYKAATWTLTLRTVEGPSMFALPKSKDNHAYSTPAQSLIVEITVRAAAAAAVVHLYLHNDITGQNVVKIKDSINKHRSERNEKVAKDELKGADRQLYAREGAEHGEWMQKELESAYLFYLALDDPSDGDRAKMDNIKKGLLPSGQGLPKSPQGKGKPKGLPKWTKDLKEMEKEIDQVLSKVELPPMEYLFPLRWRLFHAVYMEQCGGLRKKGTYTPPKLDSEEGCLSRVAGPNKAHSIQKFKELTELVRLPDPTAEPNGSAKAARIAENKTIRSKNLIYGPTAAKPVSKRTANKRKRSADAAAGALAQMKNEPPSDDEDEDDE